MNKLMLAVLVLVLVALTISFKLFFVPHVDVARIFVVTFVIPMGVISMTYLKAQP